MQERTPPGARRWSRLLALAWLLIGMLALSGCSSATPQTLFDGKSTLAVTHQNLFVFIIWLAVIVFVVVEGMLLVAIWRFRHRPGQGIPEQLHGNNRLEIAWTIAPAVVLAFIAVPTVPAIFETARVPESPDTINITVVGHQWWWEFRYTDLNISTANEFHVPADRPVALHLESADVIHSFWIPKLGGKRDVVPGRMNNISFVAEPPPGGAASVTYMGQCVEFCGTSHANMRSRATVHTREGWDEWVRMMQTPVTAQPPEAFTKFVPVKKGQNFPGSGPASSCIVCHTIEGTAARGVIGPNLSHLRQRQTMAAGMVEISDANIAQWIRDPQSIKPGAKMPALDLTEAEIQSIVQYLSGMR